MSTSANFATDRAGLGNETVRKQRDVVPDNQGGVLGGLTERLYAGGDPVAPSSSRHFAGCSRPARIRACRLTPSEPVDRRPLGGPAGRLLALVGTTEPSKCLYAADRKAQADDRWRPVSLAGRSSWRKASPWPSAVAACTPRRPRLPVVPRIPLTSGRSTSARSPEAAAFAAEVNPADSKAAGNAKPLRINRRRKRSRRRASRE